MPGGIESLRIEILRQQILGSTDVPVETPPPLPPLPPVLQPELKDLEAVRDRILSGLKLGKQAPGYRAAVKALDRFIGELLTPD